jgi:Kef-type K+ transport system membrane component KefB
MELVIANIALSKGFIGQQLFTILVLMAVVTTFATPSLLERAYEHLPAASRAVQAPASEANQQSAD